MNILTTDEFKRIKLLGDSITAGRGSSDCSFDGEFILRVDGRPYFRQTGKKCFASLLNTWVQEKYPGSEVINNGCNGINSNHVCKYANHLIDMDDTAVFLMIGANNRKLTYGMELLNHDLYRIIRYVHRLGKKIVLLSEVPSTPANEARRNRRYHMPEVHRVVRRVANETGVPFIDCYDYLCTYQRNHDLTTDEFMLPKEELSNYHLPVNYDDFTISDWNRLPDGLHPPDSVHRLIADCIISAIDM